MDYTNLITALFGSGNRVERTSGDAGVLESAYRQASRNANDAGITQPTVDNIMRQAQERFALAAGNSQNRAGLYNSNVQRMLADRAAAAASGEASKAVLDYRNSQQQQAIQAAAEAARLNSTRTGAQAGLLPSGAAGVLGIAAPAVSIAANADKIRNAIFGPSNTNPYSLVAPEKIAGFPVVNAEDILDGAGDLINGGFGSAVDVSAAPLSFGNAQAAGGAVTQLSGSAADISGVAQSDLISGAGSDVVSLGSDFIGGAGSDAVGAAMLDTAALGADAYSALSDSGGIIADMGADVVNLGSEVADVGMSFGTDAAEIGAEAAGVGFSDVMTLGTGMPVLSMISLADKLEPIREIPLVGDAVHGVAGAISEAVGSVVSAVAGDGSIICEELHKQGALDVRWHTASLAQFRSYPSIGRTAYYMWATPVVRYLRSAKDTWMTRSIAKCMNARGEFVAWSYGFKDAQYSNLGAVTYYATYGLCAVLVLSGAAYVSKLWRKYNGR